MYILITGGLGYIGSHVAYYLNNSGYKNIIIIDNLSSGIIENNKYGKFFAIDVQDIDTMDKLIFQKYEIDCIIHIAGKAFVSDSFINTSLYYNTNVIGTCNILNLMVKYKINKLIFSSSCAVYGNPEINPITEDTPLKSISPYGNTKKICEEIIKDYSNTYKFNYVILRYFNVAGNEPQYNVKDNPSNSKRIIPSILTNIINNKPILINGINHNTKDGSCIRNYIHIIDIASAHLQSLQYLSSNANNLICNLGTDEKFSILELINIIEKELKRQKIIQWNPKLIFNEPVIGDPAELYCDNTIAKKHLNWQPKMTINDIISSLIVGNNLDK